MLLMLRIIKVAKTKFFSQDLLANPDQGKGRCSRGHVGQSDHQGTVFFAQTKENGVCYIFILHLVTTLAQLSTEPPHSFDIFAAASFIHHDRRKLLPQSFYHEVSLSTEFRL